MRGNEPDMTQNANFLEAHAALQQFERDAMAELQLELAGRVPAVFNDPIHFALSAPASHYYVPLAPPNANPHYFLTTQVYYPTESRCTRREQLTHWTVGSRLCATPIGRHCRPPTTIWHWQSNS